MLKIALIRQRYALDGGAERFVARALSTLKSQGVNVTLVTREWRADTDYPLLVCNPFYIGRMWRDYAFARCVCRTLARKNFDLVQSHERIACCDIYRAGDGVHREWLMQRARGMSALARLGVALNPWHRYIKNAERRLFHSPRLRAVICNSRMVQEEIRRHFGVAEEKLHVIYNGVDTVRFHPDLKRHRQEIRKRFNIPPEATLFLFVGSGFERKGLAIAMAALAELPRDTYLLVVGRDKRQRRYRQRAAALGIAERVDFAGSQDDVGPYYGAADVLVLPTLYDPFPNVALEAMACGLPLITSTKCGAAELIEPGVNGFVSDALDVKELLAGMRRLLNQETCAALGESARRTVEPLSLDNMGRQLLELYRQLLPPDAPGG